MKEECSCGDKCKCSCSDKCSCKKDYCNEKDCCCGSDFLILADDAYMELLKERIKEEIQKHKGEEINKLAEIISKANGKRWKYKIKTKLNKEDYKEDLMKYFEHKD